MVGIINSLIADNSPKKEEHPVCDILGTNLFNEAKTIVQEKIDNSGYILEKINILEIKPAVTGNFPGKNLTSIDK